MRAGFGAALILLMLANFAGASTSTAQTPAIRNDPEPGIPWLEIAMAVEGVDVTALRKAADPNSEEQQKLVAAIELAWLRREADAAAALRASADTLHSRALRLEALNMLMAVDLRAGNYSLAATVGRESQALAPPNPQQSDLLTAAEAVKGTPPMTLSGKAQGELPMTLEKDGIPRAKVAINGLEQEAALDTGSAFSVVSQSVANRAGVRLLNVVMRIMPAGGVVARAGLGVANELVIADATFRNVVVLILPDADMDIFGEAKVGAIIGLPIFLKMGRIAMRPKSDGFDFAFGPSSEQPGKASNRRLHKLIPVLSGTIGRRKPAMINMLLDTGASLTEFFARFAVSFPDLVATASTVSARSAVIGDASLSRSARRLGPLRLDIGGASLALTGADVHEDQHPSYHGVLGQDFLRQGFTVDFDAMTFELTPCSAH